MPPFRVIFWPDVSNLGQEFRARVNPAPLSRIRRSPGPEGVVGPVYTHVKTDKHANFKWGVKHRVGKEYAG